MKRWQAGTIQDLSCHFTRPNTKREVRLNLAKGIDTYHLAKFNAYNKDITASHTLSNYPEQAPKASYNSFLHKAPRPRKPHPQQVTTLAMNKRNEKAHREASRRNYAHR